MSPFLCFHIDIVGLYSNLFCPIVCDIGKAPPLQHTLSIISPSPNNNEMSQDQPKLYSRSFDAACERIGRVSVRYSY